jgi:L-2,4-diaminobutyrate decarboxylase
MDFDDEARILVEELSRYEKESATGTKPVVKLTPMNQVVEDLGLRVHLARGGLTGDEYRRFVRNYLEATARLYHPASIAHQVAVPHHAGALASLLGAFTNNPMAIYEMGPAATAIEYFIVNWLLEKVGWLPAPYDKDEVSPMGHGAGVLTHGGSLANLTALVAARTRLVPNVWEEGSPNDLAILAPADSHYSIARAAGILGIGAKSIFPLEVGAKGTVMPERIEATLDRLTSQGKRPLAIVANACSTSIGRFDPLREIGKICRSRGIWFHVDGAHGAAALLSPRYRKLLDGVELADSITWDAHKLLRTPGLCTAILVRDARTLDGAFHQDASYLFHDKEQPGIDLVHRTIECTKTALGLKLFAVLAALGEQGLAGYIERQFAITRSAYDLLAGLPDFECAVPPQSNILCFRVHGSDELQLAIRDRLIAQGSFHLSTANFGGKRFLRMVVSNPQTSLVHIDQLVMQIRSICTMLPEELVL